MRAQITRTVLGAVALSFGFGALVAFGTVEQRRPGARAGSANVDVVTTCDAPGGRTVDGAVRGATRDSIRPRRTLIQIVARAPYGRAYLDALRERLGLRVRSHAGLTPRDVASLRATIRYAHRDTSGRFHCRGLEPGSYIAIATTLRANEPIALDVAAFDVAARAGTVVTPAQFHPLAKVSP